VEKVKAKGPATVPALHVGDIIRRHNGKSGTHSNTYSKPHSYSYTYTNTHSINYSRAQSDSQASSHATSSARRRRGEGSGADLVFFSTQQRQRDINKRK
jgi:hypothetical protein